MPNYQQLMHEILAYLSNKPSTEQIKRTVVIEDLKIDKDLFGELLKLMDEYVVITATHIWAKPEGRAFQSLGGYEWKFAEERKRKELADAERQSVIDTNKSVKSTNRFQKYLLTVTAIASILSVVVAYLDYQKEKPTSSGQSEPPVQKTLPKKQDTLSKTIIDSPARK